MTRQIVGPNDEASYHLVFHPRGNDEGETAPGPSCPRALLSKAPEHFIPMREVLLSGALPRRRASSRLPAAKYRNLAAFLMVQAEVLVYS
jgi:hypothetical protein